jgi:hypothetical protein
VENELEAIKVRLNHLEERIARLEAISHTQQEEKPDAAKIKGRPDPASIIGVRISNKRYQPANLDLSQYQDHIWFDCSYQPNGLTKSTRAVKGFLEFTDLFGEAKFRIGLTLNERLDPGKVRTQVGIGFEYNQFDSSHQWMHGTDLADMKFIFRVTTILYTDGTQENFA